VIAFSNFTSGHQHLALSYCNTNQIDWFIDSIVLNYTSRIAEIMGYGYRSINGELETVSYEAIALRKREGTE
jgi:hypothetical protein